MNEEKKITDEYDEKMKEWIYNLIFKDIITKDFNLEKDKIYKVIKLDRFKTFWGSLIKIEISNNHVISLPSFREKIIESRPSVYYFLQNKIDNLHVKYLGNKEIQFLE